LNTITTITNANLAAAMANILTNPFSGQVMDYCVRVILEDGTKAVLSGEIRGRGGMETRVSRSTAYRWAAEYRKAWGRPAKVEPFC
jgi:hypothetical protein